MEMKYLLKNFEISLFPNEEYKNGIVLGEQDQKNIKKQFSGASDSRLGSSVYNDPICPTCGEDGKNCYGHFGYITLNKPLFNPLFVKYLKQILQIFCFKCKRMIIQNDKLLMKNNLTLEFILKDLSSKSKEKLCTFCQSKQPVVKRIKNKKYPTFILKYQNNKQVSLSIDDIDGFLKQLQSINNDKLCFNPHDLIFSKYFPIPPTHVRAQLNSGVFDQGKSYQNQLTQLYQKLMKETRQKQYNQESVYEIIQQIFGTSENKNSFKEDINGKEGIIRGFILNKRIDNTFRTVSNSSVDTDIDEIGVPIAILENMNIPTVVTENNIEILQKLVNNRNKYPGANYIQKQLDGQVKQYHLEQIEESNIPKLAIGDIVYRHPIQGEMCFLNRQPTLHLYGMVYVKIKPVYNDVVQVNNALCANFNLDWDGDEQNGCFLICNQFIEGAKLCNTIDFRMTNLNDNKCIIEPNHDCPFAIYKFTRYYMDYQFPFYKCLILLNRLQGNKNTFPYKQFYSGRQIMEYLVPEMFHYYLQHPLNKTKLFQLFLDYYYYNGGKQTKIFIQNIQYFSFQFNNMWTDTLSVQNIISEINIHPVKSVEFLNEFQKTNDLAEEQCLGLSGNELQEKIIQFAGQFFAKFQDQFLDQYHDDNTIKKMINAGSKGKKEHLMILSHAGIQLNGQNLFNKVVNDRFCCYFPVKNGLRENNVVFDGLFRGVTLQSDYLSTNCFSRLGIVTQKFITSIPGYMNRKLEYCLQSIVSGYNRMLYINNIGLFSPVFSGNGIDMRYQRRQTLDIVQMDNKQISSLFIDDLKHFQKLITLTIHIRDQIRSIRYHTAYDTSQLQCVFFHPIKYQDIILQVTKNHKYQDQKLIDKQTYLRYIHLIFQNIKIIEDERLSQLNSQYQIMFQAFILDKLNYKVIVSPGEPLGTQCSQGFTKEITQKSIDAFHKTLSNVQKHRKIDYLTQLRSLIENSQSISPIYIVRFKKEFRKNLEIIKQIRMQILKKNLKDVVQSINFGIEMFPDIKFLQYFHKYDYNYNDYISINHLSKSITFEKADKQQIQSILNINPMFVEICFDTLQIDKIIGSGISSILQIAYGIALYIRDKISEQQQTPSRDKQNKEQPRKISAMQQMFSSKNIFIFYCRDRKKIIIKFSVSVQYQHIQVIDFFNQMVESLNINYDFQKSPISDAFIEKQDVIHFDQDTGSILSDYEYVMYIFDNVDSFFFIHDFKHVDMSRCEYNNIKKNHSVISIVLLQRLLYKNLLDTSSQITSQNYQDQLPQNIAVISQFMCLKHFIIPISKSKLNHVIGSDCLFNAGFESSFIHLIQGAINQTHGTSRTNATSYLLNNCPEIGTNKSQILVKINKQQLIFNRIAKIDFSSHQMKKIINPIQDRYGLFLPKK